MTAANRIVDQDFNGEQSSLKDEITTSIPIVSLQETASSQHSSNDELATESSSLETELNSTIQKLTELDDPSYDRKRRATAKEHGLQVKTLDKAVKAAKKDLEKPQSSFLEAVIPTLIQSYRATSLKKFIKSFMICHTTKHPKALQQASLKMRSHVIWKRTLVRRMRVTFKKGS